MGGNRAKPCLGWLSRKTSQHWSLKGLLNISQRKQWEPLSVSHFKLWRTKPECGEWLCAGRAWRVCPIPPRWLPALALLTETEPGKHKETRGFLTQAHRKKNNILWDWEPGKCFFKLASTTWQMITSLRVIFSLFFSATCVCPGRSFLVN